MSLRGERLDKPTYSFLRSIPEGTTGISRVYRHDVLGIDVVQKTVSLLGIPDGLARSEPRMLEGLRHKNLVEIREAQWDPDESPSLMCVTFTTPYYAGKSVNTALAEGHAFPVRAALGIGGGILDALSYLHAERGILHRDVKPGNVLLDEAREHAYVADLGSAAYLDPSTRATSAVAAGTPLYRPPEAALGSLDERSDLYGAGMVLLELMNGQLPYDDLDRDAIDRRVAAGRRALPDRFFEPAPWVPRPAASLVRALTAAAPTRRPRSAAIALRTLRNIRCVNWERVEGAGLTGRWVGTWPPHVAPSRCRRHEIEILTVKRGPDRGKSQLEARWRDPGGVWRRYASLTRRDAADDGRTVARFFREVEAAAQAAPTR